MMTIELLTLKEYADAVKSAGKPYMAKVGDKEYEIKLTAVDGVRHFIEKIKNDKHNAVIEVFADAIDHAKEIDAKIARGEKVGRLAGVPIIIKDNILFKGHKATAASKMLENFVAPYTATIVERMLAEGAVILGRANMDEFAMGTTGETSVYGAALNGFCNHNVKLNEKSNATHHVAGGSSSGSAAAVAASLCAAAIGTDTGGSIRCPAAWNGLYSLKPTYGTVSRYGIIAFASSLDQAGPICKTAADTALLLDVIRCKDELHDATSVAFTPAKTPTPKKLRIGYVNEVWKHDKTIKDFKKYQDMFNDLKSAGHEIVPISIENIDLALATYYIIAPAEAASNLARFDGVRYTNAPANVGNLDALYKETRTKFFGDEVRRRINLGNYVLSSGYFDAFYGKAKSVQAALRAEMNAAFEKCDVIIIPTTPAEAPKLNDPTLDKVSMYLIDLFTVVANICGTPALCVPFGLGSEYGLPIGFQIMGREHSENLLFDAEKIIAGVINAKYYW